MGRSEQEIRDEVEEELRYEYESKDDSSVGCLPMVVLFAEIFLLSYFFSSLLGWGLIGTLIMGFIGLGLLFSQLKYYMIFFLASLWTVLAYFDAKNNGEPQTFLVLCCIFGAAILIHIFLMAAIEEKN